MILSRQITHHLAPPIAGLDERQRRKRHMSRSQAASRSEVTSTPYIRSAKNHLPAARRNSADAQCAVNHRGGRQVNASELRRKLMPMPHARATRWAVVSLNPMAPQPPARPARHLRRDQNERGCPFG
jgi:hypothetical protein